MLTKRSVLLINKNYQALHTITVKKAISLLFKEAAVVVVAPNTESMTWQEMTWHTWALIEPKNGENVIQAISRQFKVPEIIKLLNYSGTPQQRIRMSRRAIYKRDGYRCNYCGVEPGTEFLTLDHILPRHLGGSTNWLNMTVCCVDCNRKKGGHTLSETGMKLIKKPFIPQPNILEDTKIRLNSWKNFVSDIYWNVELKD